MTYIYISLIILFAAVLLIPKSRTKAVGICVAALGQRAKKDERKEKILELLEERGSASAQGSGETRELSNRDIRKALGVSARTVVNYMDSLEREGKVQQIGDRGKYTRYKLK